MRKKYGLSLGSAVIILAAVFTFTLASCDSGNSGKTDNGG
jgi:hypothetical protein